MPSPERQFPHITTLRTTAQMILEITRLLEPRQTIAGWLRDAAQEKLDRAAQKRTSA